MAKKNKGRTEIQKLEKKLTQINAGKWRENEKTVAKLKARLTFLKAQEKKSSNR